MKYKELEIGDWYTTKSMPGRRLQKTKPAKATCCSPKCNTISIGKKKFMIDPDEEVELLDDNE